MQPQSLDTIFAPAPVAVNPSISTGNQPSQSLESIFGSTAPATKPSLDSIFSKTPLPTTQPDTSYGAEVGKEQMAGASKISESVTKGASDIQSGMQKGGFAGVPDVLKGGAEAAFGTISGAAQAAFAPITPAIQGVVSKLASTIPDFPNSPIGKIVTPIASKLDEFAQAHPDAATLTGDILNTVLLAVGGGASEGAVKEGVSTALTKDALKGAAEDISGAVKSGAKVIKEGIKPTTTPQEAVGNIIQGKTEDVAAAHRALSSIDTSGVNTYKALQAKIDGEIAPLARKVDEVLAQDKVGKSIKSFEQTVGDGKSAVKTNPVQQALSDLRDFYVKTNDAKGLANINSIENKAKINGLTYLDVNNLARLHGRDLSAYNASGELASGLTKQAAENTRMGLKNIARQGLGGKEAEALDARLSDLYDTKALVDKQVETVNKAAQKTPKVGAIAKTVETGGKIINTVTGGVPKAIGKAFGTAGASGALTPLEIEANLAKNLKIIKGK